MRNVFCWQELLWDTDNESLSVVVLKRNKALRVAILQSRWPTIWVIAIRRHARSHAPCARASTFLCRCQRRTHVSQRCLWQPMRMAQCSEGGAMMTPTIEVSVGCYWHSASIVEVCLLRVCRAFELTYLGCHTWIFNVSVDVTSQYLFGRLLFTSMVGSCSWIWNSLIHVHSTKLVHPNVKSLWFLERP